MERMMFVSSNYYAKKYILMELAQQDVLLLDRHAIERTPHAGTKQGGG